MRTIKCKCKAVVKIDPKQVIEGYRIWELDGELEDSPVLIWICTNCGKEYFLSKQIPVYDLAADKDVGEILKLK